MRVMKQRVDTPMLSLECQTRREVDQWYASRLYPLYQQLVRVDAFTIGEEVVSTGEDDDDR